MGISSYQNSSNKNAFVLLTNIWLGFGNMMSILTDFIIYLKCRRIARMPAMRIFRESWRSIARRSVRNYGFKLKAWHSTYAVAGQRCSKMRWIIWLWTLRAAARPLLLFATAASSSATEHRPFSQSLHKTLQLAFRFRWLHWVLSFGSYFAPYCRNS